MPRVVWGLELRSSHTCASLPALQTVIAEDTGVSAQEVEVYRLVPVRDDDLESEDLCVVAPDSGFSVGSVEAALKERDELQTRYERAQEALVSLQQAHTALTAENARLREDQRAPGVRSPSQRTPGERTAAPAGTLLTSPSARPPQSVSQLQGQNKVLSQEAQALRLKLQQSEQIRHETQETVEALRKEFMQLVHELVPAKGTRPPARINYGFTPIGPSQVLSASTPVQRSSIPGKNVTSRSPLTPREVVRPVAHTPRSPAAMPLTARGSHGGMLSPGQVTVRRQDGAMFTQRGATPRNM